MQHFTAHPAIRLLGYSVIIFGKEIEYSREKRNKKRRKKPSYKENHGYPSSEKLPNIIPA